ncbi:MAG: type I restriction endonuclease, partial [Kiritimatiellae bacterium]|nr:type I restriction endonuclease [Kiritimatiellia bacterium]
MSRTFNENTRVQVPAAVHLCRLGYQYYGAIAPEAFDASTNILTRTCAAALVRLNPGMSETQAASLVQDLVRLSSNDDLGRAFYQKITAATGVKYIDFENPDANEWGCTTEFECENPETHDRFRPDITCFVNGLPLAFVEVKIPNNREGILTERARMNQRFAKKAFRSFLNVTQLMIFSNNQPYDNASRVPIQGAFYATNAKERAFFNVFREERQLADLLPVGYSSDQFASVEQRILTHRNCITIRNNAEYTTNKSPQTPTNAILSSMLQKQRFLFLLRFGFAYVEQEVELANGRKSYQLQKHVMRYQQLFATYAISGKLDEGVKSGIIWHTQGSGKTALAYYNVKRLTDYFSKRATAAKFYFIVDRLDLLQQAASEFKARGLVVRTADSREELMKDLASNVVVENASGVPEITVVNIQKF